MSIGIIMYAIDIEKKLEFLPMSINVYPQQAYYGDV